MISLSTRQHIIEVFESETVIKKKLKVALEIYIQRQLLKDI